jgi:hypothetical protein
MKLRSYEDLRRFTAYLQTVADWQEGFERRAKTAQQQFETVGLDPEEQEQLLEGGRALQLLMRRLIESYASERRAA